jgi:hypothetical protein
MKAFCLRKTVFLEPESGNEWQSPDGRAERMADTGTERDSGRGG